MTRSLRLLPLLLLTACGGSTTTDAGLDGSGADMTALDAPGADGTGTDAPPCRDADGDGHGAVSCGGDDCDDADPRRYPTNTEICDGIDQDCNPLTFGPDGDGDGSPGTTCCNPQPTGPIMCGTDCDDTRATISASAIESCNGVDDNCNGMIDEGVPMLTCFTDSDGDTYAPAGAASHMACACTPTETNRAPTGPTDTDCNDSTAAAHPGAVDICDGIDNDCNGAIDDGAGAAYYADCDVDGFGNLAVTHTGCSTPTVATPCAGGVWVVMPTDCDDTRASVHPGAPETCNGLDDNCNGTIDDDAAATVASDTMNCGLCGHVCLHAGCGGGLCTGDYLEVAVNPTQTCARRGSGQVECWGENRGGTPSYFATPTVVTAVPDAVALGGDGKAMCAIRAGGHVVCWGLIVGSVVPVAAPQDIVTIADARAVAPRLGYGDTILVLHGDVLTSYYGGVSSDIATGMADVVALSVGNLVYPEAVCAVHATGRLECTVLDGSGRDVFSDVTGVTDAVAVDAYGRLVVTAAGRVLALDELHGTPVTALLIPSSTITDAVGVADSYVLRRDRSLSFTYGGAASIATDVMSVFGSRGDTGDQLCFLRASGRLSCMGRNTYGQLGNGSTIDVSGPVDVIDP